jgi:hypothetical protein
VRKHFHNDFVSRSWAVVVFVCVALVVLASAAQVLHSHTNNSVAPDRACTICSVAHAGVIIVPVFLLLVLSFLFQFLVIAQRSARPLLTLAGLYVRPPPSV